MLIIGGAAGASGGDDIDDGMAGAFGEKSETVAGGSICAGAGAGAVAGAGCASSRGISLTPLLSFPLFPNIPDPIPSNYFRKPRIFESNGESRSFFCFFNSARPVIDFAI